jgi:Polysulphide reductase, NrfD
MNAEALTIQAPNSGRPRGETALYALVAVFLFGAASVLYAAGSDALQLDMRLLTVSFLYVMGVSQAGVAFCAITRLVRAQWSKPYYRYAELATLAFAPFALVGFVLIYAYARGELLYWVSHGGDEHASPWLSERWLMGRGLIGLAIFYGVSLAYVWPSLRRERSPELERRLYLLSPWVLLAFVLCNTFFAWDFGMMLIPHWHSTVFPIHFWFGSLYAGAAALIAVPAVLGGARFGALPIRSLGMLLTAFTLMWLYFFWAQYIVIWFGNLPNEFEPVWRQMYGHYAPYFWTMMIGCFFAPFVAFLFAVVKRSLVAMCVIAVSVNVGVWLNKYLIVVPALAPADRPFDHWLDVSASAGLLAGFLAVVVLLVRWTERRERELVTGD